MAGLQSLRFFLWLLATISLASSIYIVSRYPVPFTALFWPIWLPLFLSVFGVIIYGTITRSKASLSSLVCRSVSLFLFSVAWSVAPSYRLSRVSIRYWACGTPLCTMSVTVDICGLLIAFFGLVEVFMTYRYQGNDYQKPGATTTVFIAPQVQQQQYIPLQTQTQQQPVVAAYPYQHQGYDQAQPVVAGYPYQHQGYNQAQPLQAPSPYAYPVHAQPPPPKAQGEAASYGGGK